MPSEFDADFSGLPRADRRSKRAIRIALVEVGSRVNNEIKRSMARTKSGEVYKVPGTNTDYVASAPGEAPAVATANLINSIAVLPQPGGMSVKVGIDDVTKVRYGVWLEFGYRHVSGRFVEARPWLRPAVKKTQRKNVRQLTEAVRRAVGGR